MEVANSVHAQIIHLASVPKSSEEIGYIIMRTDDVNSFYKSVEDEVIKLFSSKSKNVFFIFIPPRVSERLMDKNIHLLRTEKKKMKKPDVIVGDGHSLILIRKYTLIT